MVKDRKTQWTLGIAGGLLALVVVGAVGWWLGTPDEKSLAPTPAPAAPVTNAQAEAKPETPVQVAETPAPVDSPAPMEIQPQVNNRQPRNNIQRAELTPEQIAQREAAAVQARERVQQGIENLQNNIQVDPNGGALTVNGRNGPVQVALPDNVQVTPDANGRPTAVTINGRTINLQNIGNGGLRLRNPRGAGNVQNGGQPVADPNVAPEPANQ